MLNNKTNITLKDKKIKKKKYAYNETLEKAVITAPAEVVCESAFYSCRCLSEVIFPESLKVIEDDAFASCGALKKADLPKNLESIGERAFFWAGITSLAIPEKVEKIPQLAFSNCRLLEKATIGQKCKSIGEYAFLNCSILEEITLPPTLTEIGREVFKGCAELKKIILPDGIKRLPNGVFEGCRSLETVVLPKELEYIGDDCFAGCVSLKSVIFPEKLKKLGNKSFSRCENLETVIFPENFKTLGTKAFAACPKLNTVKFNGSLDYIGSVVFPECVCEAPAVIKEMFCTSFLPKSHYAVCPIVNIPESVQTLELGFKSILPYSYTIKNKACFNHILVFKKYGLKIFIGEKYYNDNRKIIENGNFDFNYYDSLFDSASDEEKPIISSYRLSYPKELGDNEKAVYKEELEKNIEKASVFAVERNEETVLQYIVDNCNLNSDICDMLYSLAQRKGFSNLMQIIALKRKKTGFDDLDSILKDLSI